MDLQAAALEIKAIVESQIVEPLSGQPMKVSEAKILFTVGVWLVMKLYERGIEFLKKEPPVA